MLRGLEPSGLIVTIELLALENSLLRAGLDAARVGLCIVCEEGRIITANSIFSRALGVSEDDLVGQNTVVMEAHLGLKTGGNPAPTLAEDGDVTTEVALMSDDGVPRFMMLEVRKVTVKGRSYRLLTLLGFTSFGLRRERIVDFRLQQRNVAASIAVADALADDYPLIYANAQFFNVTGYRPSEVLGRNCRFLQGEKTEADAVEKIREGLRLKRVVTVRITNYRKDGTLFLNELTISPLFDGDGVLRYFASTQNQVAN